MSQSKLELIESLRELIPAQRDWDYLKGLRLGTYSTSTETPMFDDWEWDIDSLTNKGVQELKDLHDNIKRSWVHRETPYQSQA